MDAWENLLVNSSIVEGDAWEHLTNQEGGAGTDRLIFVDSLEVEMSTCTFEVEVLDSSVEVELQDEPIQVELEDNTIEIEVCNG